MDLKLMFTAKGGPPKVVYGLKMSWGGVYGLKLV